MRARSSRVVDELPQRAAASAEAADLLVRDQAEDERLVVRALELVGREVCQRACGRREPQPVSPTDLVCRQVVVMDR